MKKRLSLLGILMSFILSIQAQTLIDGVYYMLNSSASTCTVTYKYNGTLYNTYTGDIVIPSSVTYSGKTYTVTEIGSSAFRLSTGLTSVSIPNTITSIGDYAFYGCTGLKSITIPNSITTIKEYAFSECSSLKGVRIEDGTTALTFSSVSSFYYTPFETLYIGRNISYSFSQSPFFYAPSTVENYKNSTVLSIIFGSKVTEIPKYLLNVFSAVKSLTVGSGILSIGVNQCTPVKTIFLGNTVPSGYTRVVGTINYASSDDYPTTTTWKKYAQLSSMFEVGGVKYVRTTVRNCEAIDCNYDSLSEVVNIGETVKYGNITMTVDYINPYTCYDNKYVKTCNITFGKNIGEYAFKGCSNIGNNSLINANVIEQYAFSESMNTEDVTLDVNANTIEQYAFNLTSNVISANIVVDSIGEYAFRNSMWRNSATLTLNARTMFQYSFYNTRALQNATVVVTDEISKGAFYGSMSLSGISSTLSVKTPVIGDFAFMNTKCLNVANIEADAIKRSAFNGSGIIDLEIQDCVKSIGKSCFANNKSMTTVEIGAGITTIPDSVFSTCNSLNSIEIPANIKTIDNYVFYSCEKLGKVTISDSDVELTLGGNYQNAKNLGSTKVEWNAMFSSCKLDEVYIGRNITYNMTSDYGYSPFYKNTSLRKVVNTARETDITSQEFNGCTNLQDVQLDEGVLCLSDSAFYGCTSLAKIVLPNSIISSIGKSSFAECTSLANIKIGTGIPVIDNNGFENCSALPHIDIPCNVDSINSSVFVGCTSLKTVVFKEENSELFLSSNGSIGTNPTMHESKVEPLPMFKDCPLDSVFIGRRLKYNAQGKYGFSPFCNNTTLRSVFVTDEETAISDYEFYLCTGLKTVKMGDGVERIGYWAFSGCNSLDYLSFGTNMKTIGTQAFSDCTKVTQIYSNTATPPTCGTQALDDIDEFNCVLYVPKGTSAAYNAAPQWEYFYTEETGRTPISSISLEGVITSVYVGETMTIPVTIAPADATKQILTWSSSDETVLTIDENGLLTAKKQGSATITVATTDGTNLSASANINVSVLGGTVYFKVLSSKDKTLEVTSRPNGMFYIGSIDIPTTMTVRGETYTVVSIGNNAFYGCGGLTSVEMPNTINTIGANAFGGCAKLTEITIPNSVTTIKSGAFADSKNLAKVVALSSIPPTATENAFSGISSSAVLYVPQQSDIDAYAIATGWSTFATSGNIKSSNVTVSSISLNVTSKTLSINETLKLTATVSPSDATNKSVTWTSSDTTVVTVDSTGLVNAISAGNATVTATTRDGTELCASCSITVNNTIYIDGKYYRITSTNDKTMGLTYAGSSYSYINGEYSGSVVIPSSVTYNGVKYAVTSVESSAFRGCSSITSITFPESITTINSYAFYGCTGLKTITIPETITRIYPYTFSECTGLTSIIIPDNIVAIDAYAFCNCTGLTSVAVEKSTPPTAQSSSFTGIGSQAVLMVPLPTDVEVYQAATGWSVFGNIKAKETTSKFTKDGIYYEITSATDKTLSVVFAGSNAKEVQDEYKGTVVIPSTVIYYGNEYNVTEIGDSAFQDCTNMESVTIPEGVTKLGIHGFYGCNGLSEVILPNTLTTIGGSAFHSCNSLKSLTLPEGLSRIEWYAFAKCSNLKLEIPSTVTHLGEGAFYSCESLETVNIPNGVKTLLNNLFISCTGLTTVTGGENVTTIGNKVFNGCSKLKQFTIPAGVTSIGEYAFQNTALQNVVIPSGVTQIKQYTFSGCNALVDVVISESVTSIGERAFNGCLKLVNVNIPTKLTDLATGAFYGCKMLKSINLPNAITIINNVTFSQCVSLTDVIIPEGVTYVGSYVFASCSSLKEAVIPYSVKTLDQYAFTGCSSLRKVVVESETPATAKANTFNGLPSDAVLYVPSVEAVDLYAVATGWNVFATIVPPYILGDANGDEKISISDVVAIVNEIMGKSSSSFNELAADINGDGKISVSDIVKVTNEIMNGSTTTTVSTSAYSQAIKSYSTESSDLKLDNITIGAGETKTINVYLENIEDFSAFQMDVTLPEGLSIVNCSLTERASMSHSIMMGELDNGNVRLLSFSLQNENYEGHGGALITLEVMANNSFNAGEIEINNILFVNRDGKETHLIATKGYISGTSSIGGGDNGDVKISVENRSIIVLTDREQTVSIYSLDGRMQKANLIVGRNVIDVVVDGMYIVKVGEKTQKVIIK